MRNISTNFINFCVKKLLILNLISLPSLQIEEISSHFHIHQTFSMKKFYGFPFLCSCSVGLDFKCGGFSHDQPLVSLYESLGPYITNSSLIVVADHIVISRPVTLDTFAQLGKVYNSTDGMYCHYFCIFYDSLLTEETGVQSGFLSFKRWE